MRTTVAAGRRLARRVLDARVAAMTPHLSLFVVPAGGWVRAIRDALGMSAEHLASRMRVSATSVLSLEANERSGRVQLSTLQRAADALDCDLVYALVPRQPLDAKVRAQAVKAAMPQLSRVEQTMLLEDQSPSMSAVDELRRDAIEAAIDRPGLWVGD